MDFKQVDALANQEPPLPFLVIGGYAVVAHGFVRTTVDIDLLICQEDREEWESRTVKEGFSIFHQTNTFIQLGYKDEQVCGLSTKRALIMRQLYFVQFHFAP